jgi:hypothetical protein
MGKAREQALLMEGQGEACAAFYWPHRCFAA